MANPKIKLKRSSVLNKRPDINSLELGELAINTYDGRVFVKRDTSGAIGIDTGNKLVNPWIENNSNTGVACTHDLQVSGISTFNDHVVINDSNNLGTDHNFKVQSSGNTKFSVLGNGAILLGPSAASPFIATQDHHSTSKKYVDTAVAVPQAGVDNIVNSITNGFVVSGIVTAATVNCTELVTTSEVSIGGSVSVTGIVTSTKVHIDPVGSGITYSEDLVVQGNARVTGILSIGTSSIILDSNNGELRGIRQISLGSTEPNAKPVIIKQRTEKIVFVKTEQINGEEVETQEEVSVGIGTTVSVNTSGIITASSFVGDGSGLTGIDGSGIGTSGSVNTTGIITATSFSGDITGDLTGNVTGNVTGNTSGTHTGAVTGNVTGNTSGTHTGAVTGNVTGNLTGDVTGDVTGAVTGNVTGNLTGDVTGDVTGNSTTATTLETARNITIAGDVTGTTSFNGSGDVSITATVVDDSHDHVISNVDGLQTALDLKAPLSSPGLTGTPTAPTASAGTNTTQVATTAYVSTAVANIVDNAPDALDTLNELATALGDDSNFSTTITTTIGTKLPKSGGEMTGNITFSGSQTVDGRDLSADGSKLDGIASGATNVTNNNQITNGAGYITSVAFNDLTSKTSGTGNYTTTGDFTANNFNATSDANLKEKVEVVTNATEMINELRGVKFTWKGTEEQSVGVIAQEVETVLPELVSPREDNTKTVNYNGLIGVLIEAVKEQQEQINDLKDEIKSMKG